MTFGYHPTAARIDTHTYRTTNLLFSALAHPDPHSKVCAGEEESVLSNPTGKHRQSVSDMYNPVANLQNSATLLHLSLVLL